MKAAGNVCHRTSPSFEFITDNESGTLPSQAVQRSPREVHRGHPTCCKLSRISNIILSIFTSCPTVPQPNSAQLYANRSLTHLKTSTPSPSLALADAKKAVELQPEWAKGLVRLGDAYLASGQEADATNAYSEAVQKAEGLVKIGTAIYLSTSYH